MQLSLTALLVRDYDAAIGFYVGKLGFALTADTDQDLYGNRWDLIEPK